MTTETHTELPTAVYSFLPYFSGDGYSYGGGAVVTFGAFSVQFGEGPRCHELAKKVTGAVNSHDALVAALREIKLLLSASKNDGKSAAVKESNANQAWHAADVALSSIGGGKPC